MNLGTHLPLPCSVYQSSNELDVSFDGTCIQDDELLGVSHSVTHENS